MAYLSRKGRRRWMRRVREWGVFVHLRDLSASAYSANPCRINEGALIDLKTRGDATTHARRCPQCHCPLYRDELCCPLCNRERVWGITKSPPDIAEN